MGKRVEGVIMDKTQLVKNWVRQSGVEKHLTDKGKAFGLGWKLINDYLFFLESGCSPESKVVLYDFTQFIDTFADLYAGEDDELYQWIVNNGHTIIDALQQEEAVQEEIPNAHCPLCSVPLTPLNVARDQGGQIRRSAAGRVWCKDCARKVDEKNWNTSL